MIKVSVLIPAYNVEDYILRCVQSALSQTLTEIEVIVVNDGSTDQTLQKLKTFNDPRLQIIDTKNGGVSKARNLALLKAQGEYVFQLDGDDWLEEVALTEMYQEAKKTGADIVITDAFVDDDQGKISYFDGATTMSNDAVYDLLLSRISPNIWTKLYRRELFNNHQIKYCEDISMGEDLLINIKLFYYAKSVVKLSRAFLHYIQRKSSLTKVYSERMFQVFRLMDEIKIFLKEKNVLEKYQQQVECLEYQHTYFYRVLVDVKSTKIHKVFYDKGKLRLKDFYQNPFVIKFLETRTVGEQKLERLFRLNYYLGRFRMSLIKYFH